MNCREGDLAVTVSARHTPRRIGWIVCCVRLVPVGYYHEPSDQEANGYGTWIVVDGRESWLHADSRLRPIRDTDGEDESFSWAGKPQGVTA